MERTIKQVRFPAANIPTLTRVAAYVRVSSGKDAMLHAEALRIGGFMFELRELGELPIAFDERLWHGLIDHVTVYHDERLVFHFKDGSEIIEQL